MNVVFLIGSVIFWSIIFYSMNSSAGLTAFINIVSVFIVFFGTTATVIMSYSFADLGGIFKSFLVVIRKPDYSNKEVIESLNVYATGIKKDGVLEIQDIHKEEENQFLKQVMQDLINNMRVDDIEIKYNTYIEYLDERHGKFIQAFENMGGVAGAMGMIGTLIGLVAMLLKMDDPAAIGPAMAVALLTTFYGALIGNGFTGPIATNLKNLNDEEILQKKIILKGVLLAGRNSNPKFIRETLMSMLPKSESDKIDF
jgi:chemotaxis protein MotA